MNHVDVAFTVTRFEPNYKHLWEIWSDHHPHQNIKRGNIFWEKIYPIPHTVLEESMTKTTEVVLELCLLWGRKSFWRNTGILGICSTNQFRHKSDRWLIHSLISDTRRWTHTTAPVWTVAIDSIKRNGSKRNGSGYPSTQNVYRPGEEMLRHKTKVKQYYLLTNQCSSVFSC